MNPEQHDPFEPHTSTVLMHYRLMRRPRPDSTDPYSPGQMPREVFVSVRIVRQVPRDNALLGLAYERLQQALVALSQTPQPVQLVQFPLGQRPRFFQQQGDAAAYRRQRFLIGQQVIPSAFLDPVVDDTDVGQLELGLDFSRLAAP